MKPATNPRRRSRSNDGTPSQTQVVLPIDRGLRAKLEAEFFEPTVRRAPRLFHGPKAQTGGSPAPKLTDEQVLELRRLREWYGLTTSKIAALTGLSVNSVEPLTSWHNRVHLDPGPRPKVLPPLTADHPAPDKAVAHG